MKARDQDESSLGGFSSHGLTNAPLADDDLIAPTTTGPDGPAGNARYVFVREIDRGGMGEVSAAHDTRLGRQVAVKRALTQVAARRLAHEAAITARLEHPGIVPVYDAGRDEDGHPFYVMRLIQGRTLADALPELAPTTGLRYLLAACQAVAYAHDRQIVHGDLKPANILLGTRGDTQVADWGLAMVVGDDRDRHGGVGTPAYMSPELAQGQAPSMQSDVWALGVCLVELVTKRRLFAERDRTQLARHLTQLERVDLPEALSGELRSIAARALAPKTRDRYASAAELASELSAFLDGRAVGAHTYSAVELLRRTARRLRVPLAVAGVAAAILVVSFTINYRRLQAAVTRADNARANAEVLLQRAQASEANALAGQAVRALVAGDVGEAGLAAVASLQLAPSPEATGVAVAALSSAHPELAQVVDLPGCPRVVPAGPADAICVGETALTFFDISAQTARQRWSVPMLARMVVDAGPLVVAVENSATVVLIDRADGRVVFRGDVQTADPPIRRIARHPDAIVVSDGRVMTAFRVRDGQIISVRRTCANAQIAGLASVDDGFVALCSGAGLLRFGATDLALEQVGIGFDSMVSSPPTPIIAIAGDLPETPTALAPLPGGRFFVAGNDQGVLIELAPSPRVTRSFAGLGPVAQATALQDHYVLVVASTGRSVILDVRDGTEVFRLPRAYGRDVTSTSAMAMSGGERLAAWKVPDMAAAQVVKGRPGLTSLAVRPDQLAIAVARADGVVDLLALPTLAQQATWKVSDRVVKSLDWDPTGARLAVAVAQAATPPTVITTSGTVVLAQAHHLPVRRLVFDEQGNLLGAHWRPEVTVWDRTHQPRATEAVELLDLVRDRHWRGVRGVSVASEVWKWSGQHWHREGLPSEPNLRFVASATDPDWLVVCGEDSVSSFEHQQRAWRVKTAERPSALAISHDDRWVIIGRVDGMIEVRDRRLGIVRALLRGHHGRVAAFASAGPMLYSAGWDGEIRRWDLDVLALPVDILRARMVGAWGPPHADAVAMPL